MGGGELEARHLAPAVTQNADQLPLVCHARTQPADGVGAEVTWDGGLSPGGPSVFLTGEEKKKNILNAVFAAGRNNIS